MKHNLLKQAGADANGDLLFLEVRKFILNKNIF